MYWMNRHNQVMLPVEIKKYSEHDENFFGLYPSALLHSQRGDLLNYHRLSSLYCTDKIGLRISMCQGCGEPISIILTYHFRNREVSARLCSVCSTFP